MFSRRLAVVATIGVTLGLDVSAANTQNINLERSIDVLGTPALAG